MSAGERARRIWIGMFPFEMPNEEQIGMIQEGLKAHTLVAETGIRKFTDDELVRVEEALRAHGALERFVERVTNALSRIEDRKTVVSTDSQGEPVLRETKRS